MKYALLLLMMAGVAITLIFTGCQASGRGSKDPMAALSGEWTLDWMQGTGPVAPSTGRPAPSITIAPDGKVTGFTGVNRMSSSLDIARAAKGEFAMGPVASTRMAGPPEAMQLETGLLGALQRATRYRIDGDHLVLSDASEEVLRLARR
jgi:heat shock protein HslJ